MTQHTDDSDDQYFIDTHDAAEQERFALAADAADAGAVADLVRAYGSHIDGYDETRAAQDAAAELLPTLSTATAARVADYEATKNRPATLAEVRWLDHYQTHLTDHDDADNADTAGVRADDRTARDDAAAEAADDVADDLADEL